MKFNVRAAIAPSVALFLALGGVAAAQTRPARDPRPTTSKAGTASIAGTVKSSDGRPVPRARVFLSTPDHNLSGRVVTDDSGRFVFHGLPAGAYTFAISHPRFLQSDSSLGAGLSTPTVTLAEGQSVSVNLLAIGGGAITGRVFDEYGEPAMDVDVRAFQIVREGDRNRLRPVNARTYRSNDIGEYRIANLPPGDYYLAARPGPTPGTFDSSGGRGAAETWYPGTLALTSARPVRVTVEVNASAADIQLQLASLTHISGSVSVPAGRLINTVRIALVPSTPELESVQTRPTGVDGQGRFFIDRIAPGDYFLVAHLGAEPELPGTATSESRRRPSTPYYAKLPLSIASQPIEDIGLTLQPGPPISGRVDADGPLPPGSRIIVSSSYVDGILGGSTDVVDSQGRFSFGSLPGHIQLSVSGLPPGWIVESISSGGQEVSHSGLRVDTSPISDLVIKVTPRSSQVTGTVMTSSIVPASNYTVILIPSDPAARTRTGVRTARSDGRGSFVIKGLPAGKYFIGALPGLSASRSVDPTMWQMIEREGERLDLGRGETRTISLRLISR